MPSPPTDPTSDPTSDPGADPGFEPGPDHGSPVDALARMIFETLRCANALVVAGDGLMKPLGLSAARWQLLATVGHLTQPDTVSGAARRLSLSRQAVQRVADELCAAGLLQQADNPSHARARLLILTAAGAGRLAQAEAIRRNWTEGLARALPGLDASVAVQGLLGLRKALAAAPISG